MVSIDDNSALLLYRVGPVLCCAPCQPVSAIIVPPELTHPPGSRPGHPGIFRHANAIVKALDLRYQFGLEESAWNQPGRIIVADLDKHHIGFHVDEIEDVIKMPTTGWGKLPSLLPRGIFSRTLLHRKNIYLYAEFADLQHIPHGGYLRQYIEQLNQTSPDSAETKHVTKTGETTTVSPASWKKAPDKTTRSAAASTAIPKPVSPAPSPTPASGLAPRHEAATPGTTPEQTPRRTSAPTPTAAGLQPQTSAPRPDTSVSSKAPHRERPDVTTNTRATTPDPVAIPAPSVQKTTPNTITPNERRHEYTLAIILFAVIGMIAAGLWYSLGDTDLSASTPPTTPPAKLSDRSQPARVAAPDSKPLKEANQDLNQANTLASASNERTPQAPAAPLTHKTKPTTPEKTTAHADNSGEQPDLADNYHASIKRDKDEITITVDMPSTAARPAKTTNTMPTSEQPGESQTTPAHHAAVTATSQSDVSAAKPPPTQTRVIIHVVVRGDTLWAIAKKYVHDPFRYPELARLSKIRNPDLIYPGERVRIVKRIHQTN